MVLSAEELARHAARLAAKKPPLRQVRTSEYNRFNEFVETLYRAGYGGRRIVDELVKLKQVPNDAKSRHRAENAVYRRIRHLEREHQPQSSTAKSVPA